ncbi:MAG: GNAT family N-acetyltransferase [Tissierellia bacterium]|nr:GNAT family N-acetyltransferase [Tissierellia bacterium]
MPELKKIDAKDLPDEIYFETSSREAYHIRINSSSRTLNTRLEKKENLVVRLRLDRLNFEPFKEFSKAYAFKEGDKNLAYLQYGFDKRCERYEIYNIFVEKDFRRKGLGRILMEKVLEDIDKNIYIVARVRSDNVDAVDFFESFGFEIIGHDLYAYSNDGLEKQSIELILGKFKS